LNALTEEQWQYYFKVERKQPDIELGGQLIVRESEERPHVLYIWVAAMVAGFGMAIGAIQASHYMSFRRLCRTIIATADTSHIPPSPPGCYGERRPARLVATTAEDRLSRHNTCRLERA
jgi:hypothetical protein